MSAPQDNGLPDGWKHVRFGDVVRQSKTRVDPEADGIVRYVGGEHMDTDDLRIRRWGEVGDGYLGPAFHRHFKPGQVLYGSRRTYLRKVAVADFEGVCANTTFVVESGSADLRDEFLPYVMTSEPFHTFSISRSKGSTNPYINFSDLAEYEFALPPIDEQQRMVEVLGASDATREAYRCVLHEARSCLQSAAEQAFAEPGTRWEPLSTVLLESPRNGVTISPVDRETGHWGLTIGSAGDWGFDASGTKSIAVPEAGDHAVVHEGDLFITRSNTQERVGLPFRAPEGLPESTYFSDLLVRLRPDPNQMPTWLIEVFFRSPRGRAAIRAISAGTSASMKKINGRNLQSILVPRPEESAVARLQALVERLETFIASAGALEVDALRLRGSLATALLEGRA